jgi:hypothetical protein
VLACAQHGLRELGVGGHRRGEHYRVELLVGQQVRQVACEPHAGEGARRALPGLGASSHSQRSSQPGIAARLRAMFGPH